MHAGIIIWHIQLYLQLHYSYVSPHHHCTFHSLPSFWWVGLSSSEKWLEHFLCQKAWFNTEINHLVQQMQRVWPSRSREFASSPLRDQTLLHAWPFQSDQCSMFLSMHLRSLWKSVQKQKMPSDLGTNTRTTPVTVAWFDYVILQHKIHFLSHLL